MKDKIECLDHGFVRLVDVMGNDSAIVQAARVSYGHGTKSVREDQDLINYLLRHKHTSPFEMVEFKFHCKMPIFVARQWIRHRTANVNEYSMRYSVAKDEFYLPKAQDLAAQSQQNKQGRDGVISESEKEVIRSQIDNHSLASMTLYQDLVTPIEDEGYPGLARELSRMVLPVNYYTEWYWKIDLHNLLHFLRLRLDSHAQYEIRVFAEAMSQYVAEICPMTWKAFNDYVINSITLSGKDVEAIKRIIGNISLGEGDPEVTGHSKGEWAEFQAKFKKLNG